MHYTVGPSTTGGARARVAVLGCVAVHESRAAPLPRRLDARVQGLLAGAGGWLLLWGAAFLLLLALYAPALRGEFVSDDYGFVVNNPWVREPSLEHVVALFDPWGDAAEFSANWAPVHLLLHAAQWQVFGADVRGHHVVNLALHALASVLLVACYRRTGIPALAALLGGASFLLHPANVEAVAWISEVKTLAAMVLALGALLLQSRRPAVAALLFVLALLSKALAVFALPVAIMVLLCRRPTATLRDWLWLGVWLALFAFYAGPQWHTFQRLGETEIALHPDPLVAARTVVAFAARYLAMAVSSFGLSAFHDPPRALSWLDPWWLAGLAAFTLFGVRAARTALRREPEAIYWAWAIGGWIPISQLFVFTYPLGDRYLYFPLAGLVGAALHAGLSAWRARPARADAGDAARARRAGELALVAALAWIALLAARVPARAAVWRSEPLLFLDSARHYPDGLIGQLTLAMRAGERGDAEAAASAISRAREKGYDQFMALDLVPAFDPIRREPSFVAAKADLAALWLARHRRRSDPNQGELRVAALAHLARGEREEALRALEDAAALGGPFSADVERRLEALRREHER